MTLKTLSTIVMCTTPAKAKQYLVNQGLVSTDTEAETVYTYVIEYCTDLTVFLQWIMCVSDNHTAHNATVVPDEGKEGLGGVCAEEGSPACSEEADIDSKDMPHHLFGFLDDEEEASQDLKDTEKLIQEKKAQMEKLLE
jgi:hypothetical protein